MLNLVAHLNPRRYRPIVMLFEDGPLANQLRLRRIEVIVLPLDRRVMDTRKDSLDAGGLMRLGRLRASIAHAVAVARRIREIRPALVHTNSLKGDLIGGLAARLARVPVIWHVRDRIAEDYLPRRTVRLFRRLARWLPTHVIANSRATLDTLGAPSSVSRRFSVVLNGTVVDDGVDASVTPGASLEHQRPIVGLIGRISPWKGQDVLIRAAAIVRAAGVDCEFRLIGSTLFGEEAFERDLRETVKTLSLDAHVRFLGFRADVPAEIAQLDVVVHASTVPEPFGQVIIEGMLAGRPVIATAAGGVLEIIDNGRTGLLVPPGDADALAAAILRLLADPPLRAALAAAGRQDVLNRFTIGRVARDVERLYDRLLAEAAGRRPAPPAGPGVTSTPFRRATE